MNFLKGIIAELRDRRLWPVAVALLVAIVAVPVVLSKSPTNPSATGSPGSGSGASGAHGISVTLQGTPVASVLKGRARDPFNQQKRASTATTASAVTTAATASTTSTTSTASTAASTGSGSAATGGSTAASSGATGSGTTPATSAGATTPAAKTPTAPPKPPGLTATQSYHVTLAITDSGGGLNQIDPLQRLSVLPSPQQPRLLELGVANGGGLVLFAVEPGTAVSGPGVCTPGTIECQILSLGQGQTETLADGTSFQVTAIGIDEHSSAGAADKARGIESAAGRALYTKSTSTLSALSLFTYEPSLGAVADLRNLKVGEN